MESAQACPQHAKKPIPNSKATDFTNPSRIFWAETPTISLRGVQIDKGLEMSQELNGSDHSATNSEQRGESADGHETGDGDKASPSGEQVLDLINRLGIKPYSPTSRVLYGASFACVGAALIIFLAGTPDGISELCLLAAVVLGVIASGFAAAQQRRFRQAVIEHFTKK